jgi:hypothetical protein
VEGKTQTIEGSICWWPPAGCPTPARSNQRPAASRPTSAALSGQRAAGDLGPRRLRHRRCEGRSSVHPHSYDDYRILKANLLDGGNRTVRDRMVPYTVFMDPQLGRVGMTESEAKKSGRKIRVARMPMTWVARALEVDETRGLMKAVVDAETEEILGATVLGIEGGEVMSVFQMAMMGHLKYSVLRDAVFAHPPWPSRSTTSSSLRRLRRGPLGPRR